jgi:hypothetical protein
MTNGRTGRLTERSTAGLAGVPIAYPRMSIVEHFLESKFNPLNLIGRLSPSGLGGFSNK